MIRLAEHRPAANDEAPNGSHAGERSLSTGERIAFQQIGERLKKESGAADAGSGEGESRRRRRADRSEEAARPGLASCQRMPGRWSHRPGQRRGRRAGRDGCRGRETSRTWKRSTA